MQQLSLFWYLGLPHEVRLHDLQSSFVIYFVSFSGNKKLALDYYRRGINELESGIAVDCQKPGEDNVSFF